MPIAMSSTANYYKIKSVIQTEKSSMSINSRKHFFVVDASCSKKEISSLIKQMFSVQVVSVNTMNYKKKSLKFRGVSGKTSAFKKAIITLASNQVINFNVL